MNTKKVNKFAWEADIRDEMDADMEESGMAQGEIESCLTHWSNKYIIQRRKGNEANTSLVTEPCPNCKETVELCACMRNKCHQCGKPVGNITFTICDNCWELEISNLKIKKI